MSSPLLTICIPSYNRASHLDTLLTFLKANILGNDAYDLNVVVVNNASTDDTAAVIQKHAHPRITPITVTHHRATAEENIICSVGACNGEFVWFLGDDDIPVISNFDSHYRMLKEGRGDYYLFNAAISDSNGNLAVNQNIRMNRPMIETSMASLVGLIGCLFTLAGVSNQIIRRKLLSTERGLHYMAVSQIYSMVAWIIEAAKDARVVFVNAPLVYYRENAYGDHWSRVAKKMNVCDRHFWTSGLVDLFSELIKNQCLTYAQVGRIMEAKRDGSRFSILDDMIEMFFRQSLAAAKHRDPRQSYSPAQLEKAVNFFLSVDGTTHDLIQVIKTVSTAKTGKELGVLKGRFWQLYKGRQALGARARQVERVCYGYEIIRTELSYVAIKQSMSRLREEILRTVDPLPCEPYVLVEADMDTLLKKLETQSHLHPSEIEQEPSIYGQENLEAHAKLQDALLQLDTIYRSNSWKITQPYRLLGYAVKALVARTRSLKTHLRAVIARKQYS